MKKLTLIIALLLAIMAPAMAQQETTAEAKEFTPNKNFIHFMPFRLFAGQFQLSYERDFKEAKNSMMVVGGLIVSNRDDRERRAINSEFHFRHTIVNHYSENPEKFALKFYFSPYLQYQYNEVEFNNLYYIDEYDPYQYPYYDNGVFDAYTVLGAGVVLGTRLLFKNKASLDIFFGGGLRETLGAEKDDYYYGSGIASPTYSGMVPKGGLQFGFAF